LPTRSCCRPRRPAILPSSRALHRAADSSSVDVVAAAAWSRPLHLALLITAPGTILMSERPQARPLARKAAARGVSKPVAAAHPRREGRPLVETGRRCYTVATGSTESYPLRVATPATHADQQHQQEVNRITTGSMINGGPGSGRWRDVFAPHRGRTPEQPAGDTGHMGQLDELATDAVSPRRGQHEAGRLVSLFASARLIVRGVRCWCYATDAAAW
jgi:hypothetical protein